MAGRRPYSSEGNGVGSTILLIGALLMIVLIGGGAVIFLLMTEEAEIETEEDVDEEIEIPPEEENVTIPETFCGDDCLFDRALEERNVDDCMEIENETVQQQCFEGLSYISLDACRKVNNETIHNECIFQHAVETKDWDICEYLKDGVLECKVAIEPCYALSDTQRKICLMEKYDDVQYCGDDSLCLYNYSMMSGDASYCDEISDQVLMRACRSILLDQDDCYYMELQAEKDLCRLMWAMASGDEQTCSMITRETVYALDCYSHFAILEMDPGVCIHNNALEFNNLWECYSLYSIQTGDPSGCDAIHFRASTYKFTCYFETAKKWGDPHICDLQTDLSNVNTCYVGTILDNPNLDYRNCQDVVQVSWKNKCYTEYAKLVGDSSFCEFVTTTNERNICYDAFKVYEKEE
jgi:hypothetical protein